LVRKGSKMSEETRRKLSEASKGKKYHLGKTYSEESKKKMSVIQTNLCNRPERK